MRCDACDLSGKDPVTVKRVDYQREKKMKGREEVRKLSMEESRGKSAPWTGLKQDRNENRTCVCPYSKPPATGVAHNVLCWKMLSIGPVRWCFSCLIAAWFGDVEDIGKLHVRGRCILEKGRYVREREMEEM